MPFFAPWLLLGLIAAAVPIILHILRRRTAEKVVWGAWMFLVESMRLKRRKLMIEDIILLVMRTLVLALAALAFARPFLPEFDLFGGSGMDKDVVIVLDVSGSMKLRDASNRAAFDRAIEEAVELVKASPKGTAFGLVRGERTPVILTPTPLSSKAEVLDLLEQQKAGDGTMDAPRALAAAGEVLAAGNSPAKEVVVFGDGQAYGWRTAEEDEWRRVERVFSRFYRRPPVVWRTLERPEHVKNAAIAGVAPSRRIIGTDRPVAFSVTIVNSGSEAFTPGDAVMEIDGKEIARQPVGQLLAGLSRTFDFRHTFATNGPHTVVTRLTGADDIATDSIVTNSVNVLSTLPVTLVDGRAGATGFDRPCAFLEAALKPGLKGTNVVFLVEPTVVRASELEKTATLAKPEAVVLCDVPSLSPAAMTNLTRYVERGGGLLVIPGEHAHGDFYTNALFAVVATNWNAKLKGVTYDRAPVSARIEIPESALTNGYDVAGRFSDGAAAIVSVRHGKGRTALSAFPFNLEHTTYPARPEFVPFVHQLVYDLAGTNSVSATEDLRWRSREGDLNPMLGEDRDRLAVFVDLGVARSGDDVLAAVIGKSFGIEIWRPFAIVALLLLVAELLLCRKIDAERGGRTRSTYRTVLRIVAFLAFAWMLSHVTWTHDRTRKIHRRVAVFTDRSLSMLRADANADGSTNSVTRYETATNLASEVMRVLRKRYDVEPFEFGGNATDFAGALEEAMERIPSEELAGAVFLTDGRDTSGNPPEAAARRYARLGAKVSSLVIGSCSNRADVAIERLETPRDVFLGDKIRVAVTLRADKLKGKKLAAKLMEGEKTLERREFDIDKDDWSRNVRFVHDPDGRGVKRLRVELEPVDGDLESVNNVWPFDVSVSDDRTNVLLVDRRPRWEYRYLRNLFFARDKSVHLQYVLTEPDRLAGAHNPPPPAADATRPFGEAEAGALPVSRDDWRKFDVIILGDISAEQLDRQAVENVRYCVEERGALLVLIAGDKHLPFDYVKSPLADLFPLAFTNAAGIVTASWRATPGPFALSPSGAGHPATVLAGTSSENERIWNALPPIRGRLEGGTLKPGAEVLLFAGDSTALKAPLAIVRESGRGKVLFLASDETWHLRYRKGDAYHHRFWGNVVKWGTGERLRDGNANARTGTDRLHYEPGEPVKLLVRLADQKRLPISTAKVEATVKQPDGKTQKVTLVKREGANGYYETLLEETEREGDYEVTIESKDAEEILKKDWPKPLTTAFSVDRGIEPIEYAHLTADAAIPKELAHLTGGTLVDTNKVDVLKESFGAGKSEITEHVEDAIWDHWIALTILLLSLCLLWIDRKRKGIA